MTPGRNAPCHCGSGRKYKKCCLSSDDEKARKLSKNLIEPTPQDLEDEKFFEGEEASLPAISFLREMNLNEVREWFDNEVFLSGMTHMVRGNISVPVFDSRKAKKDRVSTFSVGGASRKTLVRVVYSRDTTDVLCTCKQFDYEEQCGHMVAAFLLVWVCLVEEPEKMLLSLRNEDLIRRTKETLVEEFGFLERENAEESSKKAKPAVSLTRILFCLHRITNLTGSAIPPSLANPIPIASAAPTLNFTLRPKKNSETQRKFPAALLAQKDERSWFDGVPHDVREVINSLQYEFSDGTTLTCDELIWNPYLSLVPNSLWPTKVETPPSTGETGFPLILANRPYSGVLSKDRGEAETAIFGVLTRLALEKIPLLFVFNQNREEIRMGFPVDAVERINTPIIEWAVSFENTPLEGTLAKETQARLTLKTKYISSNAALLFFTAYDQEKKTLYFHTGGDIFNRLAARIPPLATTPSPFQTGVVIQGGQFIENALAELRNLADQGSLILTQLQPTTMVMPEEVVLQVHLISGRDEAPQIAFSFQVAGKFGHYTLGNLPDNCHWVSQFLSLGLSGVVRGDIKTIAQKKRGMKRANDLLLFRHQGIAAMILREVTYFNEERFENFERGQLPKSEEKRLKQAISKKKEEILQKIAQLLAFSNDLHDLPSVKPKSEKPELMPELKSAVGIDQLLSPPVRRFLNDFLDGILSQGAKVSFGAFTSEEELVILGGTLRTIVLLCAFIDVALKETQGKMLTKSRSQLFQTIGNISSTKMPYVKTEMIPNTKPETNWLDTFTLPNADKFSLEDYLHVLLPLEKKGIHVYVDGQRLDNLNPDDIVTDFHLNEKYDTNASSADRKIDWFELHPKVFFKGVEISREQVKNINKQGVLSFEGKLYRLTDRNLPSLEFLEQFWTRLTRGRGATGGQWLDNSSPYFPLPKNETLELLALRSKGVKISGGAAWKEICDFYDSLDKPRKRANSFLGEFLKPYQATGVHWLLDLYQLRLGGILADEMGLGKTIQTLCFLEALRSENNLGKCLIVVPTSLTYNWVSEAARFTPQLPVSIFKSRNKESLTRKEGDFVTVVTYGLFIEHADYFQSSEWNVVVFDEAQNLKNISAQRTTVARSLRASFKLCLSGTPLENHLSELFSLIDLVVPGALGELDEFRKTYVMPTALDLRAVSYLKLKIRPLVLRRHKSEILKELPEKTESKLVLPFENQQKEIYRDVALSWNTKVHESLKLHGERKTQLMMLTALLRLRQVCSNPATIVGEDYCATPPKIRLLIDALKEIIETNESALVFTQFLGTFSRIEAELKAAGITVFSIYGGTTRSEREKILKQFNESTGACVLLMTLKTGGVVLNLTKASYVFHIEPWWNPAVEKQATDRAHRMGQTKSVQVYRYIMSDSVEEKIEMLKRKKETCFESVFGVAEEVETSLMTGDSFLSEKDFHQLIG